MTSYPLVVHYRDAEEIRSGCYLAYMLISRYSCKLYHSLLCTGNMSLNRVDSDSMLPAP